MQRPVRARLQRRALLWLVHVQWQLELWLGSERPDLFEASAAAWCLRVTGAARLERRFDRLHRTLSFCWF